MVSLVVENTGTCAGAEVVQLDAQNLEASVARPVKELKGFKKVFLKPGEKQRIAFELDQQALAFYDIVKKDWVGGRARKISGAAGIVFGGYSADGWV